jgi:hypothetical protein
MPVYFIIDSIHAHIKIGKSTNVRRRIQQLQTGNPVTLHLMGWIDSGDDDALERSLHEKYSKLRGAGGEWFAITSTEVLSELTRHVGYVPQRNDAFKIIGFDRDGIPEYVGAWDWGDLELHECCPFCGSLSGMHFEQASQMHYCQKCQKLTDFEELSPPEDAA